MAQLHISKVAVGCGSVDALRRRQEGRLTAGIVPITTRFRPKRADELVGGSIYWIVKHRISVRQAILGFAESEADQRTIIRLDPDLVAVRAIPRRAHQGRRYFAASDAHPVLVGCGDGVDALSPPLAERLALLALI